MSENLKQLGQKTFSIDARVILNLGRESIKDHTTALLELVKNSYDADATIVKIEIMMNLQTPFIRISDNGSGMTEEIVDSSWLRIGYSDKRTKKHTGSKRRKTGEKGIGRISADRLGGILELRTNYKGSNGFGLEVNWDDFDVEGQELTSVPIKVIEATAAKFPGKSETGTELTIRNLRQGWNSSDIENLYEELSILTPPFKQVTDFEIIIDSDVTDEFNGKVESPFYQSAELEINAKYQGTGNTIEYSFKDKYGLVANEWHEIQWDHLRQKDASGQTELPFNEEITCGPLEISLLFYPRDASMIEGTGFKLNDLREFLNKNAGVKIYRDKIRVKPYGNPRESEGDWLGLQERKSKEPAGISRPTWKAGAHQIVGGVFIGRDENPELKDSAAREGLIENNSFYQLRTLALGCLSLLETQRYELNKTLEKTSEKTKKSTTQKVDEYKEKLESFKGNIQAIKSAVPTSQKEGIDDAIKEVEVFFAKESTSPESIIGELINQNRLLGGLATIGIASAIFGHETEASISGLNLAMIAAKTEVNSKTPDLEIINTEIEKGLKFSDQVSAWGRFALTRISKDKRTRNKRDIKEIIDSVLNELMPAFNGANIQIDRNLEQVEAYTFEMDIETIIINLLTNSFAALRKWPNERKILVELVSEKRQKDGFLIRFTDSGPGIAEKFNDMIWEPLWTRKTNKEGIESGTGLGLTIVNSIITEASGSKTVENDSEIGGARFTFWMPKR